MRKQPESDGMCTVTFKLPAEVAATEAHLCGEFNDWSQTATPLVRRDDGTFAVTVLLDTGKQYRFRYLLDNHRWENDWAADDYVPNDFGGQDSVVQVP
jgi:1,4-alpha-glucan branching enzyme